MTKQRVGIDSRAAEQGNNGRGMSEALGLTADEVRSVRVRHISLEKLRPDPVQPRRGMPEFLRDEWIANPDAIGALLDEWYESALVEAEYRHRVIADPASILKGQAPVSEADVDDAGPYETTFVKLLQDAQTVYAHGLEHPITVSRLANDDWRIQSGERRTLMHHALLHWLGKKRFGQIAAIEVAERSVWSQAAENNARQDLTAIERARQLALLLMDAYKDEVEFRTYEQLSGQAFYQQAAELKIPYGRSGDFLAAMGLKDEGQLRQYKRLLSLPEAVWQLADEHRWAEYFIRSTIQVSKTPPQGWAEGDYLIHLARVEVGLDEPLAVDLQPEVPDESVTVVTDSGSPDQPSHPDESVTTVTHSPSNLPPSSTRPAPLPRPPMLSRPAARYANDPDIDQGWQDEEEAIQVDADVSGDAPSDPPARPRSAMQPVTVPPVPDDYDADKEGAILLATQLAGSIYPLVKGGETFLAFHSLSSLYALPEDQFQKVDRDLWNLETIATQILSRVADLRGQVATAYQNRKTYNEANDNDR